MSKSLDSNFVLQEATVLLARTPRLLTAWLGELPEPWSAATEGAGTWSPFDVLGHLIHGEKTDWIPRLRLLLRHGEDRPFEPFDRFAQFEASQGRSLDDLLAEFSRRREENLAALARLEIGEQELDRTGRHPELGIVTARELLACWVAHDLGHIAQIARVMAARYRQEVGPWSVYLRIISGQET